jgi:hypothetical protein
LDSAQPSRLPAAWRKVAMKLLVASSTAEPPITVEREW